MNQETVNLKTYGRENTGKGPSRRVRMKGLVPGVVYGPTMKTPLAVAFMPNDIISAYRKAGKTSLINLDLQDGAPAELKGTKVLLKEVNTHPYKTLLIHVDLHAIDLSKKTRVVVPIRYEGKAKGVADGGVLNVSVRETEVRCAPDNIPHELVVDISGIELNGSYHLSELETKYPDLEFIYDQDLSLLGVTETREEKKEEAAEGAVGAPAAAAAPAAAKAPAGGAKK